VPINNRAAVCTSKLTFCVMFEVRNCWHHCAGVRWS
jgi:hypothetical protein